MYLPVLDTSHKRWVLNTTTGVVKSSNGAVITEAGKLVLHRLRKNWTLDVRILGRLRCEFGIKIGGIQRVNLSGRKKNQLQDRSRKQ